MRKIKNYLIEILIVVTVANLSLVDSIWSERFRGPISIQEKRIKDYKSELSSENPNYPKEMHLFFQELMGDYAIFYDLDGNTVHFKYRRNKWDRDAIEAVHNLLPSRSYKVQGEFTGILFFGKNLEGRKQAIPVFLPNNENLELEWKKEPDTIPVFKLVSYNESYSDTIIFESPNEQ
ncbi:LIC_11959 family protein [Leptospira sp. GIMC2001]|uniref:LIC_11959 family protein n=1 Tax=Leptospira sp. GIMC2001 TaxID=1513297 RepID=UPI0023495412|nr:hypothetical protein [Leptospira sp. GIMC2001]WCL50272.1 hypothetical protein O4O04_05470 [Leptospira sp. GIMC2001]